MWLKLCAINIESKLPAPPFVIIFANVALVRRMLTKNICCEKEPKISVFEQDVADLKIRYFKIASKIAKGTPELSLILH